MIERRIRSRPYHRSVRRRWILSCISLTLIPMIVGISIFFYSREHFENQTISNNEAMLLQIRDLMDHIFHDVQHITMEIASDIELQSYLNKRGTSGFIVQKQRLKQRLARYQEYSSSVQSIYIYFWDQDEFVTSTTAAPSRILYYAYHNNPQVPYGEWIGGIRRDRVRETLALSMSDGESLTYMRNLPTYSSVDVRATIMVIFSNEHIRGMMDNVARQSACELNFLLNDGKLLYNSVMLAPERGDRMAPMALDGNDIGRMRTEQQVVVSGIPSKSLDLTYLLGTPHMVYYGEFAGLNPYFAMQLMIVILGSLLMISLFVYRNYKPIRELLDLIGPQENASSGRTKDEYAVIMNAMARSEDAGKEMQVQINQQKKALRDAVAALLFHNASFPTNGDQRYHAMLREHFRSDFFAVVLLYAELPELSNAYAPLTEAQAEYISEFLVTQLARFDREIAYMMIDINGGIALLSNYSDASSGLWESFVAKLRAEVDGYPEHVPGERIVASASKRFEGFHAICEAYREAEFALKYRVIFGADYDAVHTDTPIPSMPGGYYYPPEKEALLLNAIINGEHTQALHTFDELWWENAQAHKNRQEYMLLLLYNIVGTLIRAGNMVRQSASSEVLTGMIGIMALEHDIFTLRGNIRDALSALCDVYSSEHMRTSEGLRDQVLAYIEAHYDDPSLSVEKICDEFHRSRTHLFSIFKEDTGFSLLYHINRVRMSQAKELLRGSSLSINDIAARVGFNSSISFTRAFKKYEHTTPSLFRDMHL